MARETRLVDYWRRQAAIGLLVSFLMIAFVLVYARRSGAEPNGNALTALSAGALVVALAFFWAIWLAAARNRHLPLFFLWSCASIGQVLLAIRLDGGEVSPLSPLLLVALLYPALAYPWPLVLTLGVGTVLGASLVLLWDGPLAATDSACYLVSLGLTAAMVTLAAHNRGVKEKELASLTRAFGELAVHDATTGCLNRRGFDLSLAQEVHRATRHRHPLSMLLLDVDHLKAINDRGGHAAGDAAIKAVAAAMASVARQTDVLARIGGDEFAMLLPETDIDQARAVAERVHEGLRAMTASPPVTVSIGMAGTAADQVALPEELLACADLALYAAKNGGRDRTASSALPATDLLPGTTVR